MTKEFLFYSNNPCMKMSHYNGLFPTHGSIGCLSIIKHKTSKVVIDPSVLTNFSFNIIERFSTICIVTICIPGSASDVVLCQVSVLIVNVPLTRKPCVRTRHHATNRLPAMHLQHAQMQQTPTKQITEFCQTPAQGYFHQIHQREGYNRSGLRSQNS